MARTILISLLVLVLAAGGLIYAIPSDVEHAERTDTTFLAAFADAPGSGVLDGIRFDTTMAPQGSDKAIKDFVQFDRGLFMSQECEDRCNYPPSAYLTRETPDGTAFIVEAFCPRKDTTMVWRGTVRGDTIEGTVHWTSSRLLMRTETTLEFSGTRSAIAARLEP